MIIEDGKSKKVTAAELIQCYKATFQSGAGKIVLDDINSFIDTLIGEPNGIVSYTRPHHELAACTVLNNLKQYINGLTKEGE